LKPLAGVNLQGVTALALELKNEKVRGEAMVALADAIFSRS
jgi:hypothetical protein